MSQPYIGIDLGTTYSCIAHCSKGRAEIIPDSNGNRLVPSMVYYDKDTGRIDVGDRAYLRSLNNPANFITDVKRFLGRKFCDESVQKIIDLKYKWNNVCENHDEMVVFEIGIHDETYLKKPEDVSCEILKHLKEMANSYLNADIQEAVISVPAYFNNAQRQATKRAAAMAGINVLRLITEPTAAVLHYVEKLTDGKTLVFDWGGGTLDVSLIDVSNNTLTVVGVDGDTLLGGKNIDELLYQHFLPPTDRQLPKNASRLMTKCISLKKDLTNSDTTDTIIECFEGGNDLHLEITRVEFEELCSDIFARCSIIVQRALKCAKWKREDVDNVVLVGGSTRIPKMRQLLGNMFGDDRIQTDLNPDEAVALGASVQAALLKNCPIIRDRYTVLEVTPLSLGLRTDGNMMLTYIRKNTPLPARQQHSVKTSKNNQESARFEIYEGERKNTELNNKIGEFVIEGLPRRKAGEVEFTIEFCLDLDGLLTVAASEMSSGHSKALTINVTEFRWIESGNLHIEDEQVQLKEDTQFEEYAKLLKTHKYEWEHLVYDADKLPSKDCRRIKEAYKLYLDYIENLNYTDIYNLTVKHKELMYSINDLLQHPNQYTD